MLVELLAVTPDAEKVIEQAGRTCYMSRSRTTSESSDRFIRTLISKEHLSVLEHASAAFRICGISRGSKHAQWEVRNIAVEILNIMKRCAPNVFADISVNRDGCIERKSLRQAQG